MSRLEKLRIDPLHRNWHLVLGLLTLSIFVGKAVWVWYDSNFDQTIAFSLTFLLSLSGLGVLLAQPNRRWSGPLVMVGVLVMLGTVVLDWINHGFDFPHLLEAGIQLMLPAIFYFTVFNLLSPSRLIFLGKIAIALTFVGHGLYAIGVPYTPEHFVSLCTNFFGFDAEASGQFLLIMGIIDLVISVLIFLPKVSRPALLYAALWGSATALARILSIPTDAESFGGHLLGHWYETVFRFAHGGLPFLLFVAKLPDEK